jgi:hypothetical protein
MKNNILGTAVVTVALNFAVGGFALSSAMAEETTMEKVETGANKAADSVKSTYRDAKDKVCETVNGKLECVAKKVKHKTQNAADAVETKAKELKKKVD